ncbi:NAD(P)/FAD-dependent oxidoreductase [Terrabacter sp. 2RAF25]|uniref:NAD(P)/FAD-dependent oxidoreductase n=1 Tax=Terrabacter sp. 2RAF25 TaxID=3232998 RepID=UPI003F9B31F5
MHTDIAIIGGGPAGLQAALSIGRIHRDAVLFDDGRYRNATVSHMHNVVGNDGTPPDEFRALARKQLAAYDTVSVREERVESVEEVDGTFHLRVADGTTLTAYAVVLATGVRDALPAVPGLEDLWGDLVAHCPFCHGHELSGGRIGIVGAAIAPHMSAMLRRIASELVVFSDGEPLPEDWDARPEVRTERLVSVERHDGGVRVTLERPDGERSHDQVSGLFVKPTMTQSAPFAEQLGLALNPSGCIRVDEFGRTSRPGVFAGGDLAHLPAYPMPMASVTMAAAAGQVAASGAIMTVLSR